MTLLKKGLQPIGWKITLVSGRTWVRAEASMTILWTIWQDSDPDKRGEPTGTSVPQGSWGTGPRGASAWQPRVGGKKGDTLNKMRGLQTRGCCAIVRVKELDVYKATQTGPRNTVKILRMRFRGQYYLYKFNTLTRLILF